MGLGLAVPWGAEAHSLGTTALVLFQLQMRPIATHISGNAPIMPAFFIKMAEYVQVNVYCRGQPTCFRWPV